MSGTKKGKVLLSGSLLMVSQEAKSQAELSFLQREHEISTYLSQELLGLETAVNSEEGFAQRAATAAQ